jgi:hypothetical protein
MGRITTRTFRRDHFLVGVELDGTSEVLHVVVRGEDPPEIDDRVHLDVDPAGVVALPPDSPVGACTESAHLRQDSRTTDP